MKHDVAPKWRRWIHRISCRPSSPPATIPSLLQLRILKPYPDSSTLFSRRCAPPPGTCCFTQRSQFEANFCLR